MSRWRAAVAATVLIAGLTGCGSDDADDTEDVTTAPAPEDGDASTDEGSDGEEPVDPATGETDEGETADGANGGTPEGQCAAFTLAEVEDLLGEPVSEGVLAGPLDTGCQWITLDDETDLMVQRVDDPSHWDPPVDDPGYREVDGFDGPAYLAPWIGGEVAATLVDGTIFFVNISPAPDDATMTTALAAYVRQSPAG